MSKMANEKRLIDANALAQKLKKHHDFYIEAYGGFEKLPPDTKARVDEISACWAAVYNEPTVDAVEVVRCKDCFANDCCSVQIALDMGENGYCAKGRKENR